MKKRTYKNCITTYLHFAAIPCADLPISTLFSFVNLCFSLFPRSQLSVLEIAKSLQFSSLIRLDISHTCRPAGFGPSGITLMEGKEARTSLPVTPNLWVSDQDIGPMLLSRIYKVAKSESIVYFVELFLWLRSENLSISI